MGTSQLYSVYNSNAGGGTGLMDWTAFQPAGVMTAVTSTWNHIAITFELQNLTNGGPGAVCRNYLNGALVGSGYATRTGGSGPFCLGSRMGSNAAAFSVNDCVLRNRILTAAEVAAEYALG